MVWATPGNISTANLDSNTDSVKLARADIKTAFDEFSKVANNTKTSWTPAFELGAGSFTSISYSTQTGNFIRMGAIVFYEFKVVANITIDTSNGSNLTAYNADLFVGGLPVNPSSVQTYVGVVTQQANFQNAGGGKMGTNAGSIEVDDTGTRLKFGDARVSNESHSTIAFAVGQNVTNIGSLPSAAAQNNVTLAGNGWYMV